MSDEFENWKLTLPPEKQRLAQARLRQLYVIGHLRPTMEATRDKANQVTERV